MTTIDTVFPDTWRILVRDKTTNDSPEQIATREFFLGLQPRWLRAVSKVNLLGVPLAYSISPQEMSKKMAKMGLVSGYFAGEASNAIDSLVLNNVFDPGFGPLLDSTVRFYASRQEDNLRIRREYAHAD